MLLKDGLKSCFNDPTLEVMNFLNEVVMRYPEAISLAPGRPAEHLFDVRENLGKSQIWIDREAERLNCEADAVYARIGQYGATSGLIRDLLAAHLERDEGIRAASEEIMVTTGCQEGMTILLLGLFDPARDVLLVSDPSYIGITGMAAIQGVEMRPIASGEHGLEVADVEEAIRAVRASGKRPRALYDVPDFNNPLGSQMPLEARHELLALAKREELLIFEDNPYGAFAYDDDPLPTLKSLDEAGVVIYLGSFSKTLFPSLRIGYLVADQKVLDATGEERSLLDELSKVKSLITVNTSALPQITAGGILLENDLSLRPLIEPKLPFYRANRDRMLERLQLALGDTDVRWNRPGGGFFLTVTLPFSIDHADVDVCARDHGVIFCPMSFFSQLPGREQQIRLSFSYVDLERIDRAIDGLAGWIRTKIKADATKPAAPAQEIAPTTVRVDAQDLAPGLRRALKRRGVGEEHADRIVDSLIEASLRGVDTHGVRLLPTYLQELDGGRAKAVPKWNWSGDGAVRRLDAGGALGLVAGHAAVDEIIRLSKDFGVGVVSVCNSNHFGPGGAFALRMARAGLIGIAMTNSDALVAPFGGTAPIFGTNPIAVAAAGRGDEVFSADFATSQASWSKVRHLRSQGADLPPGWALDADGRDMASAAPDADVGALKPLGGYKGQCLAMIVEMLCAILAGEPSDHELSHLYGEPYDEPRRVAHFLIGVRIDAIEKATTLQEQPAFRERLSDWLDFVRSQPGLGGAEVSAPGDPEDRTAQERSRLGIPLSSPELDRLIQTAQKEDPELLKVLTS